MQYLFRKEVILGVTQPVFVRIILKLTNSVPKNRAIKLMINFRMCERSQSPRSSGDICGKLS